MKPLITLVELDNLPRFRLMTKISWVVYQEKKITILLKGLLQEKVAIKQMVFKH